MNEQITRQAQEMLAAAQSARIPENVQAFAQDTVTKTREGYEKLSAVSLENAKVVEQCVLAVQGQVKAIGEAWLGNAVANTEAAFDAAQAIARAKTLPEAARLQMEFVQKQVAVAGSQTKDILTMSADVTKQAYETINAAATKTIAQMGKAG